MDTLDIIYILVSKWEFFQLFYSKGGSAFVWNEECWLQKIHFQAKKKTSLALHSAMGRWGGKTKRFICFRRVKGSSGNERLPCICICAGSCAKTPQSVARTKITFLSLPSSKYEKHHTAQGPGEGKIRHCKTTKLKMMGGRGDRICMLWTQGAVFWPVFYDSVIALPIFHSNKREQMTGLRGQR